jgi:predicted nucleic-acid-binding Zn-ribbon protein
MQSNMQCPECGGKNLHRSAPTGAAGGYGPDLLPGLGKLFSSAEFTAVLCADCGLVRYYATQDTLARLGASSKWHRLK